MDYPNIFTPEISQQIIERINKLNVSTRPGWGKMDSAQMFAHCCVAYELVYENKHPKPNAFVKFLLKSFIKNAVTGKAPYKHSSATAPAFLIKGARDFEVEKSRLIAYIKRSGNDGPGFYENRESHSFGKLDLNEWNTLFYKHVNHHLTQFGV